MIRNELELMVAQKELRIVRDGLADLQPLQSGLSCSTHQPELNKLMRKLRETEDQLADEIDLYNADQLLGLARSLGKEGLL